MNFIFRVIEKTHTFQSQGLWWAEKNKIIKKIEDYKKQISQLENNLTFVSEKSDTSIFSNVHSNIDSFKREIEKLEKNLNLISKS